MVERGQCEGVLSAGILRYYIDDTGRLLDYNLVQHRATWHIERGISWNYPAFYRQGQQVKDALGYII